MIASDRARVRAREVERLMSADLDNDHNVARAEIDSLIAISPEGMRGRLDFGWRSADTDGNGTANPQELTSFAGGKALEVMPEEAATAYRAYMLLDLNGNGHVVMKEVIFAVDTLQNVDLTLAKKEI